MQAWQGKRVLVVGLGASGLGALRLLQRLGAQTVGADQKSQAQLGPAYGLAASLAGSLRLGVDPQASFEGFDAVVVSPGVPPSAALLAAKQAGLAVLSEVELAASCLCGTLIGVTGTNGKSTVTALLGAMAEASGRPTFVGGNLGTPLSDAVFSEAAQPQGLVVAELSSFQLEQTQHLRPKVAVWLNLAPDHLDRYATMQDYAAAKQRIFLAQEPSDAAVIPSGDALLMGLAKQGRAAVHCFGEGGEVQVQQGMLCDRVTGWQLETQRLPGHYPLANACAAVLAARLAGLEPSAIEAGLLGFAGLPHRLQQVAEHAGVRFIDDSKATNVAAAVVGIEAVRRSARRIVLIAGGLPKGDAYAPLVDAGRDGLRAVVVLGQAAPAIAAAFGAALPVQQVDSIEAAVLAAAALAQPGDAVLLCPACASFDMFRSYAERGDRFAAAARRWAGQLPEAEVAHA